MRKIDFLLNDIDWDNKAKVYGRIHESIKCQLYRLGEENSYYPIPEYNYDLKEKEGIDMVWLNDENDAIYAFEIDWRWEKRSVNKLNRIDCQNKIIISFSNVTKRTIKDIRLEDYNIHQYFIRVHELW